MDLQTTDTHRFMAMLVEEPEQPTFFHPVVGQIQTSSSRMAQIQSRNLNREMLVWYEFSKGMQIAALDLPQTAVGRVIVQRDSQDSEYACPECRGKGHSEEACSHCEGRIADENGVLCPSCVVIGFGLETKHPSGYRVCAACRGAGWKGGIIIPEKAQGIPVTGVVVSVGPNTNVLKLGDRVMFSCFAGHAMDNRQGVTLIMMRESEVLSLVRES
jgi:co-chaperonin GroES (HSP10)